MKQAFSIFLKRTKTSRGASSAEYVLCCLFLCVGVCGAVNQTSAGIQLAFLALDGGDVQEASMNCDTCMNRGGGGDDDRNFTDSGPDLQTEGGGSDTSQTIIRGEAPAEEPPPEDPIVEDFEAIQGGVVTIRP